MFAVVRRPRVDMDAFGGATLVVMGTMLSDPGNVGTLMRSAAAAGATALGLGAGSVDAYNPKVVRASAGACFAIRTVEGVTAVEMLEALGAHGFRRLGAVGARRHRARGDRPPRPALPSCSATKRTGSTPDLPLDDARDDSDAGRGVAQRRHGRHRSPPRSGPPAPDGVVTFADDTRRFTDDARRAPRVARASIDDLEEQERLHLKSKTSTHGLLQGADQAGGRSGRRPGDCSNEARGGVERGSRRAARSSNARPRAESLVRDRIDLTIGGGEYRRGHLHPVTRIWRELEDVFVGLGYKVAEGPEVELDWYNFEALNFPPGHPARAMQDTLYVRLGEPEQVLLRTHTSPVQVRTMEAQKPPIYVVAPGRVFRRDTLDARHSPVFHQIEGLAVDEGITLGDLLGTIEAFIHALFGPNINARFLPSFFPFTEPSVEFAMTCVFCEGAGCTVCSKTGWVELGGAGMVDPDGLRGRRHRPRALHRIRVRVRHRPGRAAPVRHRPRQERLGRRRPFPAAILRTEVTHMRAPLSWIREFTPVDAAPADIADALNQLGLEVEEIDEPGRDINGVVVAKILDVVPHPDADRIRLADVDFGDGQLRVVCGAPNIHPGMVAPFARVGATLPGDFTIERRKIRGVVSEGMLASARELGLGDDHSGILELPADAPLGADVREVLGLDDVVFDLAITPNRPDAMGITGVAREIAAYFGLPFAVPELEPANVVDAIGDSRVVVEAPDRCPRFVGDDRDRHDGSVARVDAAAACGSRGCVRSATSSTSRTTSCSNAAGRCTRSTSAGSRAAASSSASRPTASRWSRSTMSPAPSPPRTS